ncbi:hypothetical protein LCGC14_2258610 [marine sediment metagenome]|uniref:Uncharacterized protein n=1 Tax=marine sediment metagenome TaxID=412755 RepID=A0A0F9D0P2_9ZZZZ
MILKVLGMILIEVLILVGVYFILKIIISDK